MAHDRIGIDVLPLTHEFLSLMLGVRRAGVTEALSVLQRQKLITYRRGNITIRDRDGLKRQAGSSYGVPNPSIAGCSADWLRSRRRTSFSEGVAAA